MCTRSRSNKIVPCYKFKYNLNFNLGPWVCRNPKAVNVQAKAYFLNVGTLGSWVRFPLEAQINIHLFLCCVILCRWRPCDGLITSPTGSTKRLNEFITPEIFNWKRHNRKSWKRKLPCPFNLRTTIQLVWCCSILAAEAASLIILLHGLSFKQMQVLELICQEAVYFKLVFSPKNWREESL